MKIEEESDASSVEDWSDFEQAEKNGILVEEEKQTDRFPLSILPIPPPKFCYIPTDTQACYDSDINFNMYNAYSFKSNTMPNKELM